MPGLAGESLLTTLFADVHYYFADPAAAPPPHHRFDRGSYVYLYHSAQQQRAKIEIANHAGTPDQDASSGYLDRSRVRYSHTQPNLLTVTAGPTPPHDTSQWHLPAPDPRGETQYMYPLHTLDIYFWTAADAASFLKHLHAILAPPQIDELDAPRPESLSTPPEHRDSMSPVVRQLEQTAIGAHFPPRETSASTAHTLPGPPTPAISSHSPDARPPSYAPLAYNPAAPAAPERIAYRAPTPPPPDDGPGTTGLGLSHAALYETAAAAPVPFQQASYFPGPPATQRTPSFAAAHTTPQPPPPPPPPPTLPNASPSQQMHYAQTFPGPPQNPAAGPPQPQAFSNPAPAAHPAPQHLGYSPYTYQPSSSTAPQALPGANNVYDVHQQVYRPTEAESRSAAAHHHVGGGAGAPPERTAGRVEERVGRVEKGVGRWLKKLDSGW